MPEKRMRESPYAHSARNPRSHHDRTHVELASEAQIIPHFNTPPQADTRPNSVVKCFTFVDGRAFVRTSATISSVGQ